MERDVAVKGQMLIDREMEIQKLRERLGKSIKKIVELEEKIVVNTLQKAEKIVQTYRYEFVESNIRDQFIQTEF